MMLKERVLNSIKKYNLIEKDDKIIVGLSGGPDSVCLLHVLHSLSEELGIKVFAVHINHMLRGQESNGDEAYAREICTKMGIELYVKSCDIMAISKQRGLSLEETGREIRYGEFDRIGKVIGGAKIAVAHNKNDQAETVLMRIIRGTGIDGLKGMLHKRQNIIRPLLDVERKVIEEYCRYHLLNPRIDSSNKESLYTRNRIRLELIPYINELFETDIIDSLYKMSLVIRDDYDFIEKSTNIIYKDCIIDCSKDVITLDLGKLRDLDTGALKRTVRFALGKIKGSLKGIENVHIENCINLIYEGRTGAVLQLPHNLRLSRSYGIIKIYLESGITPMKNSYYKKNEIALNLNGITVLDRFGSYMEAKVIESTENSYKYMSETKKSNRQFFDYEKLKEGINIRGRMKGDIFKPLNSPGTKKLKEYLIDKKIPRDLRDKIPLVAKNNEIVWIIGNKISDKFKVTENTKRILELIYIEKQGNGQEAIGEKVNIEDTW